MLLSVIFPAPRKAENAPVRPSVMPSNTEPDSFFWGVRHNLRTQSQQPRRTGAQPVGCARRFLHQIPQPIHSGLRDSRGEVCLRKNRTSDDIGEVLTWQADRYRLLPAAFRQSVRRLRSRSIGTVRDIPLVSRPTGSPSIDGNLSSSEPHCLNRLPG